MEKVYKSLQEANLRLTKQRKLILDFLISQKKPVTSQEIISALTAKLDPVTVYRNVDQLASEKILRKLEFGERANYYEINHGDDHHHIICKNCKKIEPIDICHNQQLNSIADKLSKKFSQISGHMLEFYGVCKSCEK